MTDRYTRKDAERAFLSLATALGKDATAYRQDETGRYRAQIGAWALDCNATYGGYVINEICTDGGGVTQPFGSMRQPAREFCQSVRFALDALRVEAQQARAAALATA